jgi:Histone acetyltransferase
MEMRIIEFNSKDYEAMIRLRLTVLLNPIGITESYINKENEKKDILIGLFNNDLLIGCCILSNVSDDTIQLRQMAVLPEYQKSGSGRKIIAFSESIAKEKGFKILMMHARDAVLDFYKKCGYQISGPQFFEVGVPHHRMEKEL